MVFGRGHPWLVELKQGTQYLFFYCFGGVANRASHLNIPIKYFSSRFIGHPLAFSMQFILTKMLAITINYFCHLLTSLHLVPTQPRSARVTVQLKSPSRLANVLDLHQHSHQSHMIVFDHLD